MRNIKLSNGTEIPIVGSGTNTFGKEGNEYTGDINGSTKEIEWALQNGYRHFDSAQLYRNESVLGKGLRASLIPREEFYITTKLNTKDGYGGVFWARSEIEKSLEKLQTDYFDLFLIHFPWDNQEEIVMAWDVLEEYYNRGVFGSIGVSNFQKEHLDLILKHGNVKPAVNQIESHPGKWNDELIAYNQSKNIATVAWGPIRATDDNTKKTLEEIGKPYGKTFAQVILRYQIERDVIVIPKSHHKGRQAESLDIFDFELTEDERKIIAAL